MDLASATHPLAPTRFFARLMTLRHLAFSTPLNSNADEASDKPHRSSLRAFTWQSSPQPKKVDKDLTPDDVTRVPDRFKFCRYRKHWGVAASCGSRHPAATASEAPPVSDNDLTTHAFSSLIEPLCVFLYSWRLTLLFWSCSLTFRTASSLSRSGLRSPWGLLKLFGSSVNDWRGASISSKDVPTAWRLRRAKGEAPSVRPMAGSKAMTRLPLGQPPALAGVDRRWHSAPANWVRVNDRRTRTMASVRAAVCPRSTLRAASATPRVPRACYESPFVNTHYPRVNTMRSGSAAAPPSEK